MDKDSATLFYPKIRVVISARIRAEVFAGEVEVDESYFGGARKGKRGRGARGEAPVFGLLERAGKVYTVSIENLKVDTLIPIIKGKVIPDSIVYTDGFKSYDVRDVSEFRPERVNHAEELVDPQGKPINGIENFWSQAKRVLRKYNGIPRQHFHLFIKECEFRFNGSSRASDRAMPVHGSRRVGDRAMPVHHGSPSQQPKTLKRGLKLEGSV